MSQKIIKIVGFALIFFALSGVLLACCLTLIEVYYATKTVLKKERYLWETEYYGKKLNTDPYQKFSVLHLHPYYFFSLPWREKDRLIANNEYVTLDELGFRLNKSTAEKNIVLLGGSTAFGYLSSSDKTTIAALLSKELNVRVINRNAPSWNSTQELMALFRLETPYSASLSFSTANDMHIFCHETLYKSEIKDQMRAFTWVESHFHDARISPKKDSLIERLKSEIVVRLPHTYSLYVKYVKPQGLLPSGQQSYCNGEAGANQIADVIVKNQEKMRDLSQSRYGVTHYLVIQPWYPLHQSAMPEHRQLKIEEVEFRSRVIKRILQSDFCKESCLDLSKAFDANYIKAIEKPLEKIRFDGSDMSLTTAMFADDVHLTDLGVKEIVRHLANYLRFKNTTGLSSNP